MGLRRTMPTLVAGAALVASIAALPTVHGFAATTSGPNSTLVACTAPAWAEGTTYPAGTRLTYAGRLYQALVTHTPPPGAG